MNTHIEQWMGRSDEVHSTGDLKAKCIILPTVSLQDVFHGPEQSNEGLSVDGLHSQCAFGDHGGVSGLACQ